MKAHATPTQPKAFAATGDMRTIRHMLAAIVIETATVFNNRMDLLTANPLPGLEAPPVGYRICFVLLTARVCLLDRVVILLMAFVPRVSLGQQDTCAYGNLSIYGAQHTETTTDMEVQATKSALRP